MIKKKKIVFIINPISGTVSKSGIPALIEQVLDKEKYSYEIRETEHAGHAEEIAIECKEQGVDVVVAVGGDGTDKLQYGSGHHTMWKRKRTGPPPDVTYGFQERY